MSGKDRSLIKIGQYVLVVQKKDQGSGIQTKGVVRKILTKSSFHPHGIKVLLDTNEVGRVQKILEEFESDG